MDGLVKISKYAGMREDLVQAGGGNTSYKIDDHRMMIKSSGIQLADVSNTSGYSIVDYTIIAKFFENSNDLDVLTEDDAKNIIKESFKEGGRPSIETFLHSISGTYTLHTHPVLVDALACRNDWRSIFSNLFPGALMVKYATPGIHLSIEYFKAIREFGEPNDGIVILQNHGLVVSGNTADEVIEKTEDILYKIEDYLQYSNYYYHNATAIWNLFPDKIVWTVTDYNVVNALKEKVSDWNTSITPDCVVYMGKKILSIEKISNSELDTFRMKYAEPIIVEYAGWVYIIADTVRKAMEIQSVLSFSVQINMLNKGIECTYLSEEEENYLLNWDAEKYRKSLNQ